MTAAASTAALGCNSRSPAPVNLRAARTLPALDMGWIALKDHFVQTVGPRSGQGEPYSDLLVLADATLAPKSSFPMHPHREMEILTWIVSGTMLHRDSTAAPEEIPAGTLQLMSARNGLFHAEGNRRDAPVRLLQIWLTPDQRGGDPVFKTAALPADASGFVELAGPGPDAPLQIRQDARLLIARLQPGQRVSANLAPERRGYAITVGGEARWNGQATADGDGMKLGSGAVEVVAGNAPVQALLFDLRS
ncbi:MAG: pirin family protein [Myxococcaceae bacterium]